MDWDGYMMEFHIKTQDKTTTWTGLSFKNSNISTLKIIIDINVLFDLTGENLKPDALRQLHVLMKTAWIWKSIGANLKLLHAVFHLWFLAALWRFSPKHQLNKEKSKKKNIINIEKKRNQPTDLFNMLLTWIISANFCSPLMFRKTPGPAKKWHVHQSCTNKQERSIILRICKDHFINTHSLLNILWSAPRLPPQLF